MFHSNMSETFLTQNVGRREMQVMFLEWRLPMWATYYSVRGAHKYLQMMTQSQQLAISNSTSIARLSDLLKDEGMNTFEGSNSRVVGFFRKTSGFRMREFYTGIPMKSAQKTKLALGHYSEWGAVYHTNGKNVRKYYMVLHTLPVYAGAESGTFLAIEDWTMNYCSPSWVAEVLKKPKSMSEEDLDFPGADTAGLLCLTQMPRAQVVACLAAMEWHSEEMYKILRRAGFGMYRCDSAPSVLPKPDFDDDELRNEFLDDLLDFNRNERLRKFFKQPEKPSNEILRPLAALCVIIQVCLVNLGIVRVKWKCFVSVCSFDSIYACKI